MRRRMSAFEIYLRAGRRVPDQPELVETKFNPWHDPDDGRFTFAGQGRHFGGGHVGSGIATANPARRKPAAAQRPPVMRAMGSPIDNGVRRPSAEKPLSTQPPRGQRPSNLEARRQPAREKVAALNPVPGYLETGTSSWRKSNDQIFVDAADRFNSQRGLKPGDPKYVDPLLIKAWAMVESGGSQSAFLADPLQVNNPGDYKKPKPQVTGLAKNQRMTPATSTEAAMKWLEFGGYYPNYAGKPGPWIGIEGALQRYNGRSDLHPTGVPHKVWYARQVLRLYRDAKKAK